MNDLISREKAIEVLTKLPGIGHKALNAIRDLPEEKDAEAYQRGYETGFAEGRKQADDEIRVGDEVVYHAQFEDYTGFVIEVKSAYLLKLMLIDGSIWSVKRSNVEKTGRNLQMVEKLLEAMKG